MKSIFRTRTFRAFIACCASCAGAALPCTAAVAAPAPPAPSSPQPRTADRIDARPERVVARVKGQPITMGQLMAPLVEAHGLNILLNLIQLESVKQYANAAHLTVTPADFQAERELTLNKMFHEADDKLLEAMDDAERKKQPKEAERLRGEIRAQHEELLDQFLTNQRLSRPEFDLVLQTNAYLRKIAEPQLKGRVTDDLLHKQFDVEYGQTLRARFIQLDNLQQVAEAKQRLEKGERFEQVARRMSRDPQSAAVGGLMNDFSRGTTDLPQNFRDVAFATEVGKVSETVQANNAYFLIKPEKKFEPKAVKFESVKESLRAKAYDILMQETVAGLRRQLAADAMASLQIDEPTLKRQFDDRKNASAREQEKQAKMRKAQEERELSVQDRIRRFRDEHPTTAPAKAPAVGASR